MSWKWIVFFFLIGTIRNLKKEAWRIFLYIFFLKNSQNFVDYTFDFSSKCKSWTLTKLFWSIYFPVLRLWRLLHKPQTHHKHDRNDRPSNNQYRSTKIRSLGFFDHVVVFGNKTNQQSKKVPASPRQINIEMDGELNMSPLWELPFNRVTVKLKTREVVVGMWPTSPRILGH